MEINLEKGRCECTEANRNAAIGSTAKLKPSLLFLPRHPFDSLSFHLVLDQKQANIYIVARVNVACTDDMPVTLSHKNHQNLDV